MLSGTEAEQHWISYFPSLFAGREWQWISSISFTPKLEAVVKCLCHQKCFGNIPFRHHEQKKSQFFEQSCLTCKHRRSQNWQEQVASGSPALLSMLTLELWRGICSGLAKTSWTFFTLSRSGRFWDIDHELKFLILAVVPRRHRMCGHWKIFLKLESFNYCSFLGKQMKYLMLHPVTWSCQPMLHFLVDVRYSNHCQQL